MYTNNNNRYYINYIVFIIILKAIEYYNKINFIGGQHHGLVKWKW